MTAKIPVFGTGWIDLLLDAICVVDAEGRFVFVSAASERIFGYRPEEMIGKQMIEMVVPEDRARTLSAASQIMSGHEQLNFENRYLRKDGKVVHILWSARWSEDDRLRIAVARDVTKLKQSERQLAQSEEQYRLLVTVMDEGVVLQDENAAVIAFNKSAERILGITADQLMGKTSFDPGWRSIHEDGSPFPGETHPVVQVLKTGIPQSDVIMGIHKPNGELTWISINAQPIFKEGKATPYRVVATMRDITDRKRNEMALLRYKAAIDTTHEGFWITDDQGRLLEVNQAYATMCGYGIDELKGMHIAQLEALEQSQDKVRAHMSKFVSRGWDIFETRHRRKDGSEIELEVTASYVPESKQFVAFLRDISQHKEDQKKINLLTRLYSALSHANHALIECTDETELFDQICRIIVTFGGMKMAWIGKADTKDYLIKPVASYGEGTIYLDGLAISLNADHIYGKGPTAIALREGHAVIADDFATNPLTAPFYERAKPYGWAASATFPIMRNGRPYAVISLYHAEKHPFTNEMIELMSEMMVNIGYGLDRFDLEADKQKAEESMRLAATIYESTAEAIMVTDENNLIIDINPAFTAITGYTLEEVRGKNPRMFKSGRHEESFYEEMWQSILQQGHWQGEVWDRRKDGELYAKWLNISVIRHPDGSIYRHVGEFSDITEKKRKDELIWTQANFDALTNLPNRRLLADRIHQAMASGARSGQHGALIELDLDHFKQLNDTLGHSVGDKLLIEVARRLQTSVREEDTVARLGGDEFVVVLNELSSNPDEAAALAEQVAQKIRSELSSIYQLGEIEYHTTPSVGVVLFHDHSDSQDNLLAHVDAAMYQAKAKGRNTICFYDSKMQEALEKRSQLEHALRAALSRNEFMLYYQLQVDNRGRPLGTEALLRWKHPELGMVSPAQFIPLAEESGLILPIGHWVLETACAQLARWQDNLRLAHLSIAINVSARQFRESTFVAQVRDAVGKRGIRPEVLKLELTESLVLEDVEDTINKLKELKHLGIKFSMDDFGTGYSSLAYLSRLPFDQLKIDQSFMRDVTIDQHNAAIVQTIISMAQSLGMEVIAEGVETAEQREFLELRGCLAYQGYYFAKPLPIDELEQKMLV
jgi:diguanylate cyclase (GGDEF)-like protein/PAS domain S-box-containing protein